MNAESDNKKVLSEISSRLKRNGYDSVSQIIGFLITEDPTYITNKEGARKLAMSLDRDVLLKEIVECYFDQF